MTQPNNIPAPSAPMTNPQSGMVTTVWWQFFLSMFGQLGGGGTPIDLSALIAQLNTTTANAEYSSVSQLDLGGREALARIDEILGQLQDVPTLSHLRGRLDDLETWVGGLQQPPVTPQVEQFTAPTFANAWVNFGTPYNPAGYFKDAMGVVHLRGVVMSGTINVPMFTLPVGYRPLNSELYPAISNGALGGLRVYANGDVVPFVGSNAYFSIDGVTFRAA